MPVYGPWFVFPIIGVLVMILVLTFVLGPRGPFSRHPWRDGLDAPPESPLDILKRRYAKGELSREQFEQMRRDLE